MKIFVEFESHAEAVQWAQELIGAQLAAPESEKEVKKTTRKKKASADPAETAQAPAEAEPAGASVPATVPTAVPTAEPSYSSDDLAKAAIGLMDQGRQQELQNLLAQFGVSALPELPQEQYGAFATALRQMGAVI